MCCQPLSVALFHSSPALHGVPLLARVESAARNATSLAIACSILSFVAGTSLFHQLRSTHKSYPIINAL
jgi:hypothetical protein